MQQPPNRIITQPPLPQTGYCPPGLESLLPATYLFVQQQWDILEVLADFEVENRYVIKNQLGQDIYYAAEESGCCARCCLKTLRPFEMKIIDRYHNLLISLKRPCRCQGCCYPCCLQKMEVYMYPNNLIGTVQEEWSLCIPMFKIKDAVGETVLRIEGPFCTMSCCGQDVEFKVLTKDGKFEVGKISKKWSGFMRELFTDADFFGVSFPLDLEVKMKAVMLGAVFLIDMMFFEEDKRPEARAGLLVSLVACK